jgi:hypothetical protein
MGLEVIGIASAAASLAGAGISAYSSYQSGKSQKALADYNANISEQNAADQATTDAENAKRSREANMRQLGMIRAKMAKAGVLVSGGSSLDVLGEAASEYELATLDAFSEGVKKQDAYMNEANSYRYQGKQAETAGKIGAVGSLLSGVTSAASSAFSFKQTGVI